MRTYNFSAGLCILALMTGLPTTHGAGRHPLFKETFTNHTAHKSDGGLNIRTHNGGITVRKSDRTDVEIIAHVRCVSPERLEAVEIIAERESDGTLNIHAKWPGLKRKSREGCSFEVLLPDALNLDLLSSNGAITCEGFGGNAVLKTSNGRISLSDHEGPVTASTSNGAIDVRDVTGRVTATTSNGRIDAQNIAGAAELRTSNGAIRAENLIAPANIQTSNGSISLELAPSFAGEMTVSTSQGSLDISELEDAKLISSEKKRITFAIGNSDLKSSATTSNGSITMRR